MFIWRPTWGPSPCARFLACKAAMLCTWSGTRPPGGRPCFMLASLVLCVAPWHWNSDGLSPYQEDLTGFSRH
ncbi:unnamed protein product [Urochloa humidicola]